MRYRELVGQIRKIASSESGFQRASDEVARVFRDLDVESLLQHLEFAGIIPEEFEHDSTEEKLYAKYCDIIIAQSLSSLGIPSETILERAEAADVVGEVAGKYKLVADAKAFRLSRTAKNQKDFKVEALSGWRSKESAKYALLVGPLYQFPNTNSQIYGQSITHNVTLLSYTHLHFMIRASSRKRESDLEELWKTPARLDSGNRATSYWEQIDASMLHLLGGSREKWNESKLRTKKALREIGKEQIDYWQAEIKRIKDLNHEQAVKELIEARNIRAKIETIEQTIQWS